MAAAESQGNNNSVLPPPVEQSLAAFQAGQLSLKDFEWEPHFRPAAGSPRTTHFIIPEIDLQPLVTFRHDENGAPGRASYDHMVASLAHAASTCGFFQVFNHNISLSAIEALNSYGCRFFSLPLERKYEVGKLLEVNPSAGPSGYICGNPAHSANKWWSESLRVASTNEDAMQSLAQCLCPHDHHQQQAFRAALKECSTGFAKLAKELSMVLVEGLGVGREAVEVCVEEGDSIAGLKLSHYPACPQPHLTLGIPPHSDVSIVTLLWQDLVGGLQVNMDGHWITVEPRHDALVVNIGDVFQIWSNDHYLSGLHRAVLNTRESRYSMVYFYYSGVDSLLSPLQQLLEKTKESPKFRSTLLSKHRSYVRSEVTERASQGVDYLRC